MTYEFFLKEMHSLLTVNKKQDVMYGYITTAALKWRQIRRELTVEAFGTPIKLITAKQLMIYLKVGFLSIFEIRVNA